jgi:ParB family chromosome partitioning protein
MNDMKNNEFKDKGKTIGYVRIDEIVLDPNLPRKCIDKESLEVLVETIKMVGVLQPILVRKDDDGKIHLVAGKKRVLAAKMAGRREIPAIFVNLKNEASSIIISLIENIYKTQLTPLDEGEALGRLKSDFMYSDQSLMKITKKSEKEIKELLEFGNLPDNVKEYCRDIEPSRITTYKLRRVLKLENLEKADGMILWDYFYSRQRRYRGEIVQDKAKSLQKTLEKLDAFDFKHTGKEMKTELMALNKAVFKILN